MGAGQTISVAKQLRQTNRRCVFAELIFISANSCPETDWVSAVVVPVEKMLDRERLRFAKPSFFPGSVAEVHDVLGEILLPPHFRADRICKTSRACDDHGLQANSR